MKDGAPDEMIEAALTYDHERMNTIEISSMQTLGAHIDAISAPTVLGRATHSAPCGTDRASVPTSGRMRSAFSASPITAAVPFNPVRYPTHEEALMGGALHIFSMNIMVYIELHRFCRHSGGGPTAHALNSACVK